MIRLSRTVPEKTRERRREERTAVTVKQKHEPGRRSVVTVVRYPGTAPPRPTRSSTTPVAAAAETQRRPSRSRPNNAT